jgi:sucrose phosphorylase
MHHAAQLIAYADRFGNGMAGLRGLLDGPLAGLFGGVHILPFYHPIDGADAGFDPIDHLQVDPRLGGWEEVQRIARTQRVMADVIVNHISAKSPQFLDYAARGSASPYAGLFLTREAVFPNGATPEELARIYRPRPGLPFTPMTLADGRSEMLWTTFTREQLDIDVHHPVGRQYLENILDVLGANGVSMARLDAVGYAIKRRGTSCFMLPETFEFIGEFAGRARRRGIEVLVEIHSYYQRQVEIARHVDWVYDFALPPLLLHAFAYGTANALAHWIAVRPQNAVTVLDTHDGIGIVDVGADPADRNGHPGLVPPAELDGLVEWIHRNSKDQSRKATGAAASNLDLYQVNCTYFDALGGDDDRYLAARAVQLFLPGIPQIYYVGLLAGHNDMQLLARTGVGRDINRHHYTQGEITSELQRPVVQRLCELLRLRNRHPAFGGTFHCEARSPAALRLTWQHGAAVATLDVDFAAGTHQVSATPLEKRA